LTIVKIILASSSYTLLTTNTAVSIDQATIPESRLFDPTSIQQKLRFITRRNVFILK